MSNFDYEISNLNGNLGANIQLLAEKIVHSAVEEAIMAIMGRISYNMETQNINTNNVKTQTISTSILESNYSKIKDVFADKVTIKDNIKIYTEKESMELTLNDKGIFSKINDNKNALVMLETIKNILIESGYTTQEGFDNEYNNVEKKIDDIINGEKVANKLMENPRGK